MYVYIYIYIYIYIYNTYNIIFVHLFVDQRWLDAIVF